MTVRPSRVAVAVSALSFPGLLWLESAVGDEVVTVNGNYLTGKILQANREQVLLKTDYAGIVRIERGQVKSLRRGPSSPSKAAAPQGSAGSGSVAGSSRPKGETRTASLPAAGPTVPETAELPRSSVFTPGSRLQGQVNFSLSDEKGNTDKNEIDFDYQADYRWGWNRLKSLGALEFDTTDGQKTTDKWSTYNQYSRMFPSRWYGAAWLAFKHDRFADLRLRTLGGPGIGYLAFESKALNLSVEIGPAALQDDFYDHVDHRSTGSSWSLNYDQLLWRGRLQPYHRQFSYVALDGKSKFLWHSWTGLRVPLGGGFVGSLEFEYDYDSSPAVNAKTTDTTLRLKLGYKW